MHFGLHAVDVHELFDDPDAQPGNAIVENGQHRLGHVDDRRGIEQIGSGDHVEDQRRIGHAVRKGPDLIE